MKIAFLEDNKEFSEKLNKTLGDNFELSFYDDQFKLADNSQRYDLVLIEDKFISKELISKLIKSGVEIGLLKDSSDFDDQHLAIILDKNEIDTFEERIKYFETKIRIKKLVDIEDKTFKLIQTFTDKAAFFKDILKRNEEFFEDLLKKFYVTEKEGIGIVEIKNIFDGHDKDLLIAELEKVNYKVVAYFSHTNISSMYLNVLISLWKAVKEKNGKFVYWDKNKDKYTIDIMKACKLDNLIKIVDSFEDAIKEMKGN